MHKIDILAVDESGARLLQSILESYGASVLIHWIRSTNDIVNYLESESPFGSTVIINCRGDDGAMLHMVLSPNDLMEMRLSQWRVVLNTGCAMGTQEFANPFLRSGTANYIGTSGYPKRSAVIAYTASLFYNLISIKKNLADAHNLAAGIDEETATFKLFQSF